LDVVTFTMLLLVVMIVTAIVVMAVQSRAYRDGSHDGEEIGAARREARYWQDYAKARMNAEELAAPRAEGLGDKWKH
jgi:hypothetical protein